MSDTESTIHQFAYIQRVAKDISIRMSPTYATSEADKKSISMTVEIGTWKDEHKIFESAMTLEEVIGLVYPRVIRLVDKLPELMPAIEYKPD